MLYTRKESDFVLIDFYKLCTVAICRRNYRFPVWTLHDKLQTTRTNTPVNIGEK